MFSLSYFRGWHDSTWLQMGLILVFAAVAGAEPTSTQPATTQPVIQGKIFYTNPARKENIKITPHSLTFQSIYAISNGKLLFRDESHRSRNSPSLWFDLVGVPPGAKELSLELTAVEDSAGRDIRDEMRTSRSFLAAGSEKADEHFKVEMPLSIVQSESRDIRRIAGRLTMRMIEELSQFEFGLDQIGATATFSDTASVTLKSCEVIPGDDFKSDEWVLRFATRGNLVFGRYAPKDSVNIMNIRGTRVLPDPQNPYKILGEVPGSAVQENPDLAVMRFRMDDDPKRLRLRLYVTTKTLEVQQAFDLRAQTMN